MSNFSVFSENCLTVIGVECSAQWLYVSHAQCHMPLLAQLYVANRYFKTNLINLFKVVRSMIRVHTSPIQIGLTSRHLSTAINVAAIHKSENKFGLHKSENKFGLHKSENEIGLHKSEKCFIFVAWLGRFAPFAK